MEDPRPAESSDQDVQPAPVDTSLENENDPEAIANRVMDVFWKSLRASREQET